jgi:hypothetical protein
MTNDRLQMTKAELRIAGKEHKERKEKRRLLAPRFWLLTPPLSY